MDCCTRTAVQAILAGVTLLCAVMDVQAIEVGACVAKSDLNSILQRECQVKVVGALQQAVIERGDKLRLETIKVTFTTATDGTTGWVLKEDGCLPASTQAASQSDVGVRFYLPLRQPKVFDAPTLDTPSQARIAFNAAEVVAECELLKPKGIAGPDCNERADVNRTRLVNENFDKRKPLPVTLCTDPDTVFDRAKRGNDRVIFQAETVTDRGFHGTSLTVVGNVDGEFGQVFLTNSRGATVDSEGYSEFVFIDDYQKYVVK